MSTDKITTTEKKYIPAIGVTLPTLSPLMPVIVIASRKMSVIDNLAAIAPNRDKIGRFSRGENQIAMYIRVLKIGMTIANISTTKNRNKSLRDNSHTARQIDISELTKMNALLFNNGMNHEIGSKNNIATLQKATSFPK